MKTPRLFAMTAFAAVALLFACTPFRNTAGTGIGQGRTTLKVDNRAYLDMTIYVLRGAERVRLGQATGASTSTFVIPADLVQTAIPLQFIADPIGSSRAAISEQISVRVGDEVMMEIPPA